ncbi:multicopper oxidase family protein [Bacillus sp. SD088]|uniref:multicopper oxidase family protein n=1 Tax=Bacillus sp. SD088 TaxID=2782012 RepID=UPI001A957C77|nr:multicopper oxidase [Bacillus sp. SD088]MBO0995594.1 multicopper oxidase domain-containing protein [Bacillus sp. SD088]
MALTKFVDKLPIIPIHKPIGTYEGIPYYEVSMRQIQQKLHRDLPPTTVWGYNGIYPGPTFEAIRNQPIYVKWKNKLPFEHLLPVDRSIMGAGTDQPSVRTVVHLHGGRNRPGNDGSPDAWFTHDFGKKGPNFVKEIYYYPNCQRPATLWYHDHALGITRLNVYAGLSGFYVLRDQQEGALNLPSGEYEIPLLIQDKSFYPNGELYYPAKPDEPPTPAPNSPPMPNPSIVPEFFGDTILVNGKVWPYLEVEPRKYRFRILNGSNARFYNLGLSNGQKLIQIGTDGGLLESPIEVNTILLSPAERVDIIIDFSKNKGDHIILTNSANAPFPGGSGDAPIADTSQIIEFRVRENQKIDDSSIIPSKLSCMEILNPIESSYTRVNTLDEDTDEYGRPIQLLNKMMWGEQPITETPSNGKIEIWEFYNTTNDSHPIHLHLIHFQILDQATFSGNPLHPENPKEPLVIGKRIPPLPNERGWKDTVRVDPGMVTRIIARFGPYTGIYPWHCHMLEHEDHDMMRPYEVLKNPAFDPCVSIPSVCVDDSFAQCFHDGICRDYCKDSADIIVKIGERIIKKF